MASYGHEKYRYWCLYEEQEKCRSAVKVELKLKNFHRFKSYGQIKIECEIMPISFVFWAQKLPLYRKHFVFLLGCKVVFHIQHGKCYKKNVPNSDE